MMKKGFGESPIEKGNKFSSFQFEKDHSIMNILSPRVTNHFLSLVNFDICESDICLSYATRFQKFCFA
jgi:hypothetical protein